METNSLSVEIVDFVLDLLGMADTSENAHRIHTMWLDGKLSGVLTLMGL